MACMAGISGWWGEGGGVGECGDRAGSGDFGDGVRDQRSAAWGREKGSGGAPIWIWTGLAGWDLELEEGQSRRGPAGVVREWSDE